MISSILIEALARRAMQVVSQPDTPTVPVFRAAFEDELKRFDNALTPPPVRAKLVPEPQPSLGKGIGQQTGGTAQSDGQEARTLLGMIAPCGIEVVKEICGDRAAGFVAEQVGRSNAIVTHFTVTGKQLFWLREIKDKLVDRGVI